MDTTSTRVEVVQILETGTEAVETADWVDEGLDDPRPDEEKKEDKKEEKKNEAHNEQQTSKPASRGRRILMISANVFLDLLLTSTGAIFLVFAALGAAINMKPIDQVSYSTALLNFSQFVRPLETLVIWHDSLI